MNCFEYLIAQVPAEYNRAEPKPAKLIIRGRQYNISIVIGVRDGVGVSPDKRPHGLPGTGHYRHMDADDVLDIGCGDRRGNPASVLTQVNEIKRIDIAGQ